MGDRRWGRNDHPQSPRTAKRFHVRHDLVNRVAEPADLRAEAVKLARSIAQHSPVAVRMIKRATYQSADADLSTALDLVSSHLAVVAATEDSGEAFRAMAEKRTPNYTGR